MYEAVRSKEAQDYWDNGKCDTPEGPKSEAGPESSRSFRSMPEPAPPTAPRARFVIEF
jgi:hypothetical protein